MRLAKSVGRTLVRSPGRCVGVATNTLIQLLTLINVEVSPYGWHPWASIKAPSTRQYEQYPIELPGEGCCCSCPPRDWSTHSCRFKYSLRLSVIWFPAGARSKSSLSQFRQAARCKQPPAVSRPLTLRSLQDFFFLFFFSTSGRQSIDSYCVLIKQQCWPILKTIRSGFK